MKLLCRLLTHLAAFRVSWKTVKQLRRDEKELEFEVLQGEGKRRRNTRFRALQFVGALMRRCSRQHGRVDHLGATSCRNSIED